MLTRFLLCSLACICGCWISRKFKRTVNREKCSSWLQYFFVGLLSFSSCLSLIECWKRVLDPANELRWSWNFSCVQSLTKRPRWSFFKNSGSQPFTIFARSSVLRVWQGSENAFWTKNCENICSKSKYKAAKILSSFFGCLYCWLWASIWLAVCWPFHQQDVVFRVLTYSNSPEKALVFGLILS